MFAIMKLYRFLLMTGSNASYSYGNLGNSYFIILFFYRCLLVKQTNSEKVL